MKTALVTGATRGIGKAIAERLEADGYEVIRWGSKNYDLCDPQQMHEAGVFILSAEIDILVNNAGAQVFNNHATLGNDLLLMTIAPSMLCDAAFPHMALKRWGRIVNISSIAAQTGGRGCMGYDTAKAGLERMTKALAVEWGGFGITVNAVEPGFIDTDMLKPLTEDEAHKQAILGRIPAGRFGKPEEVAAVVSFFCRDEAGYVNGCTMTCDGGWLCR